LQLPARAARQLPDQSTTLRVESSSTDDPRLRGALPLSDSCTAAKTSLFDRVIGPQQERFGDREAQWFRGFEIDGFRPAILRMYG
jgi:hypothetical protein